MNARTLLLVSFGRGDAVLYKFKIAGGPLKNQSQDHFLNIRLKATFCVLTLFATHFSSLPQHLTMNASNLVLASFGRGNHIS